MEHGTMTMDHATMTMAMGSTVASAASAAATSAMSMDHDHGGMGMGGGCKISMLWNWNTVDSCFISSSWHITSSGMFAGSCIGVILLVMALEFFRRSAKEYDRFLVRQHQRSVLCTCFNSSNSSSTAGETGAAAKVPGPLVAERAVCTCGAANGFRPGVLQQIVRAALHMVTFAIAYFVMLLAMYYNGYIIICIFIGAFLGSLVFSWEVLGAGVGGATERKEEATVCCG
ncbi:Ctr-domain-containing protein [Patellaria atrata CBS 101060]|uniref:Copper transport protein n=1 Tax=Patellaria atrata CBS 101060 TaxID=1346257 RepID=A0A9P4S8Z0_9PEZI|nr:Ctr-domain-containing protein [Patellaria atrata CBS 101060]